MSFPVIAMRERVQEKCPNMLSFIERVQHHPAFIRAQEKADF